MSDAETIEQLTKERDELLRFKAAYSRALDAVELLGLDGLPPKPGDDPFFASDGKNFCAVDVLVAEALKIRGATA